MNNLEKYGAGPRQFAEVSLYEGMSLARVVSQSKDIYKVVTEEGEAMAEVLGKLRHEATRLSDFPAVGDFVAVDRQNDKAGNVIIHGILTRKSVFERRASGKENETQIVAANIDYVFLCMSLNSNYNLSRLERYLSVAWSSGATPVVVLTKSDLSPDLSKAEAEVFRVAPAVDIISTTMDDRETANRLLEYLKPGKTGSFIGSSGVGKSTLVNILAGRELLETGEVRDDGKGRHTTTRRELIVLPSGGIVIDTPGMRDLGADSVDLARSFEDIDELASACKFKDCTHTNEPGCAVLAAIADGSLDERRLENYKKLKKEAKYDGLSSKEIETEKFDSMFKEIGGMKNIRKFNRENNKRR